MSSNKDRMFAECFRKGNDAANKQDWDTAVMMFGNCVKMKPDLINCRQLLRGCTKKKFNDNGKGKGTLGNMSLISIRSKIKKAKSAGEWEKVSMLAEEGLETNPWDAGICVELAEASLKLDRSDIARMAYFDAIKAAPKDKAIHVAFANLLEHRSEFSEAAKLWEMVQKIDPKDMDARRKISELNAKKGIEDGGYEHADSSKDVKSKNNLPEERAKRQGQPFAPGEDPEADLKHAIRRDPEVIENYLKLAGIQKSMKKFDASYQTMVKALEVSGNDANVREQLEDSELLLMKYNVDVAKEKANEKGDDAARKRAVEMSQELRQRRIEILSSRELRYPANLNIKLELAQLLMQLQNWSQAIPLLQKAGTDPRLKTKALVNLGKCFVYDGKNGLAKSQFEKALPDLRYDTEPETYKECYYLLARVCEDMNDAPAAINFYGEVIVVDYDYKDARVRMEKLQGG